jgi:hypothetical protein
MIPAVLSVVAPPCVGSASGNEIFNAVVKAARPAIVTIPKLVPIRIRVV